jgi:hypothetical protein
MVIARLSNLGTEETSGLPPKRAPRRQSRKPERSVLDSAQSSDAKAEAAEVDTLIAPISDPYVLC